MQKSPIFVLLIDDDPDDTLIINEDIQKMKDKKLSLSSVDSFKDGINFLSEHEVDVVLLDLNLPDSSGLDTVINMRREFPILPVIALTGVDDEEFSSRVVQAGAQDYLVKGEVTPNLMAHSIRYAIERQQLLAELERTRQREQETRELNSLEKLSQYPKTTLTSQIYGFLSLREGGPEFYSRMVEDYANILDLALEQRAFYMEDKVTPAIRQMADQLVLVKSNARDVIEIHTAALKTRCHSALSQKVQAYIEEGRIILLRLMGNLAMNYRNYYIGDSVSAKLTNQSEKKE